MAISAEIKYRLNRLFGNTPYDVQLGDLLDGAFGAVLAAGTIISANLASDAVTTVKILNANVTKAKLAAGVSGSHMVVSAASHTTVGGGVSEDITIAGALNTDIPIVTIKTAGASPVVVRAVVAAAGKVTLTFSADPSNDHVLSIVLLRATS